MYENLTRFMASDLPAARRSLARVIIITGFVQQKSSLVKDADSIQGLLY